MSKAISRGVAHNMPADLGRALMADTKALVKWNALTPLARNEWICWVTFVKQSQTRKEHVERVISELKEGKRRPCCWIGCIHRIDKPMSSTQKWVIGERAKTAVGRG